MKVGIMQPYFFPYLGYFQLISACDVWVNLDHVSFMKRSYMTRNKIKDNTININVYGSSQNKRCCDVIVNFENNYTKKLFTKLQHTYSKSKYYEKTIDFIKPFFEDRSVSISQFNLSIIKSICNLLDIKTKIIDTSVGITDLKKESGLKEITKSLNSNIYINAVGGMTLYNKLDFKNDGIELYFIKMQDLKVENKYSSILDLLFNYSVDHLKEELNKYELI